MSNIDLLRNLRIASPCHKSWERMVGDERVRHCDSCQLNVYNFSEMTTKEVKKLIETTEGQLCGRIYRRSDGTVITRDCPVGLRAVRMKVARFAGAVFATILTAVSITFSQIKQQKSRDLPTFLETTDEPIITDPQLLKTQQIQLLPEIQRSPLPMLGLIPGVEDKDLKPPKKSSKKPR